MAWLDIFASDKIQNKAVDFVDDTVKGVGTWVDNWNFTEEEKTKSDLQVLAFRLDVLKQTADESSARSISRRFLAWAVTIFFFLVLTVAMVGFVLKAAWAVEIMNIAKLIYSSFIAIISFYFASNIIGSAIDKIKK